jgi:[ribosomal protein S5]-alanine N-acetyltransferase
MKILETERLILRTWTYKDASELFEICREPEVMLHIGDRKPYETVEKAKEFLNWAVPYQKKNGFCRWAVIEKSSGRIIGSCGFALREMEEVELGYLFAREKWGKGFATEAASACLKYGFENIGLTKIIALTDIDHVKSQKVLEKIGFTPRGIEKTDDGDDLVFEIADQSKID